MFKNSFRKFAIVLLVVLAMFQLAGCAAKSEAVPVTAQVIDKEYVGSHLEYGYHYDMLYGKFRFMYKMMPSEYNITVQYEDITKTFESQSLYNAYEIDDTMEVVLTTYYDSDGVVTSRCLSRGN